MHNIALHIQEKQSASYLRTVVSCLCKTEDNNEICIFNHRICFSQDGKPERAQITLCKGYKHAQLRMDTLNDYNHMLFYAKRLLKLVYFFF